MEHGKFLASLPEPEREEILAHALCREAVAGEVLIRAGMPVAEVFFPTDGILAVSEETGRGDRRITALVGPDGFADFSLAMGITASARMDTWVVLGAPAEGNPRVRERLRLYAVPLDTAQRLLGQLPAFNAAVMRYLGWTVRRMSDYLRIGAEYDVGERTAATLLEFALMLDSKEVPVPQKVLAERIGARRETVAVALGELREEGVIRTRYRRILVNSLDSLRAAAGGAALR